jgi:hypothetical protein
MSIKYTTRKPIDGQDYGLWLTTLLLLTMGIVLALFSMAYMKDLQTLLTVPDAIWDAVCGRPDPESLTLPMLLTTTLLMFMGSGGVHAWRVIRKRRQSAEPENDTGANA